MKVIIAGSRTINNEDLVFNFLNTVMYHVLNWDGEWEEVISGGAKGADSLGEWWAQLKGLRIMRFNALWQTHGKSAGPIRNEQMAKYADALVLIHDGSKGSLNMLKNAKEQGLPIIELRFYNTD